MPMRLMAARGPGGRIRVTLKSPEAFTRTSIPGNCPPRRSVRAPRACPRPRRTLAEKVPGPVQNVAAPGASLELRGRWRRSPRILPRVRAQSARKAASSSARLLVPVRDDPSPRLTRTVISGEKHSIVPSLSSISATSHSLEPDAAGGVSSLKRPPET